MVVGTSRHRVGLRPLRRTARAEPIERAGARRPDGAAVIGYTSGTTADPKGVVHTHRTLGFEVRQLCDHQASGTPNLAGAPVGHAIGMLGGLLFPLYRGRPLYLIDGWDPPTVLDAMVEEQISAGSGSTYFFTSLLDCPGFGPEHVALMRHVGLGGSPIPDAVAERADGLGISLIRAYGCTEHPSVTGSRHDAPRRSASTPTAGRWRSSRCGRSTRTATTTAVGGPGEILTGARTASPGTPTPR